MRKDTQIGVILGLVILVIIGVFLSTRTSDEKTVLPNLVLSEIGRQKSEGEEFDIKELIEEAEKSEPEKTEPEKTVVVTPDDTSLEGKWEGVAEEIVEEHEIAEKLEVIEEPVAVIEIPSIEEAVTTKKEPDTSSYNVHADTFHKVQSNDSLFKIATKYYGDGKKWIKIFEANKNSMSDPNALHVGQQLLIPDITVEKEANQAFQSPVVKRSNSDTHTVEAGDTLYRLAKKYYDDPGAWIKILEANEDTIEDEGSLKEGQVLNLPKR